MRSAAIPAIGFAIATAVFAVNLSFLVFQLAPYRAQLRGPSRLHLACSGALVLAATTPLIGLRWNTETAGRLAVAMVPLLGCGSLWLAMLALKEAEPKRILARRASRRRVRHFATVFETESRAQTLDLQVRELGTFDLFAADLDDGPKVPPPMHEIGYRVPPPPIEQDPLEAAASMLKEALKVDDAPVFVLAMERFFDVADQLVDRTFSDADGVEGWQISSALTVHVNDQLGRLVAEVAGSAGRDSLADRFVESIALRLRREALERAPHGDWSQAMFGAATAVTKEQIARGADGAGTIGLLLCLRHVVERSLRRELEFMESYSVGALPAYAQMIGESAVDAKNSDVVYWSGPRPMDT